MTDGIVGFMERHGTVPLAWAGSTTVMDYANLGDALSPVMVALCTGKGIARIPMESRTARLAAVGTIGHGLAGGEVCFWGTGSSAVRNPSAKGPDRVPYRPPPDTLIRIAATRGPYSERLLSGGHGGPAIYGDPVWLLPRFYRPNVAKRWKLGVILHLSELADRACVAHPQPHFRRFEIPPSLRSSIQLLNTVTPIAVSALRARIDEILACERIVSTSLHGMVLAEAYGIPCLYFGTAPGSGGLKSVTLSPDAGIDLRILDLYAGLGSKRIEIYDQDRLQPTDWEKLIAAVDSAWEPRTLDENRLLGALPLPCAPVSAPDGATVFDLPLIRELQLQHDVDLLHRQDAERALHPAPATGGRFEAARRSMRNVVRRVFTSGASR